MTNFMVKSGSGRICFTIRQHPVPSGFPKNKSGTVLKKTLFGSAIQHIATI